MKTKELLFLLLVTSILFACSNNEDEAPVEIKLASSLTIQPLTRSASEYAYTQNAYLADNQVLYAWVDENDPAVGSTFTSILGWQLTASSNNGTLTGTTQYYPASGKSVDVYAVHGTLATTLSGYSTITSGGAYPTHTEANDNLDKVRFKVNTDQKSAGGYESSDLLYIKKNCVRQTSAHNLALAHQFSKIEVLLVAGDGITGVSDRENLLKTATVKILNTKLEADATFSKSAANLTITPAGDAPAEANSYNAITARATGQSNDDGNYITIASNTPTQEEGLLFAEAIIVPQEISDNTTFIQVELTDGGVLRAKIPNGTDGKTTFTQGTKYIYKVTVSLTELKVQGTIASWAGGTTVEDATAKMDDVTP